MLRRIIALLLCMALLSGLAGCGANPDFFEPETTAPRSLLLLPLLTVTPATSPARAPTLSVMTSFFLPGMPLLPPWTVPT